MRIMCRLRDIYPNAEITLSFLDVMLQKEGIGSLLSVRAVFQLNERDRSDLANVLACKTFPDTTMASSKGLSVSELEEDTGDCETRECPSGQMAFGLPMGFVDRLPEADLVLGSTPFRTALDFNSEHGPGPDLSAFEESN